MADQATELRRLVAGAGSAADLPAQRPHLIAVAAGKGGVGTTTIAIGLAAALASEEQASLLVDGNANNPDVMNVCGLACGDHRANDPLGATPWGPAGMHVATQTAGDRALFFEQMKMLPYGSVVVDAGSGLNRSVRDWWRAADQVVLVTGEDAIAAMDAYAAIKLMAHDCPQPISIVVNGASSDEVATGICDRITKACRRFLGRIPLAGGRLGHDTRITAADGVQGIDWLATIPADAMLQLRKLAHHTTRIANENRRSEHDSEQDNEQMLKESMLAAVA